MKRISLTTPALLILLTLYAPHFTIASSHTPTFNTIEALPSPPCLTGNYTIGPGGDYTTFSLAANHLNDQGVCGTVVFNVLSGTYTENFNLTDLAGVSASNTITFQAQSGDPADVILQTTSINDVIILHNADHITFKDLTISYMGSGTQSAIELQDDSDHITVNNCVLNGGSSTSTANTNALIYSNESIAADQCDHFILENSTLNGAANGIYFSNSNGNNVGTRISGNSFTDQFRNGVYLDEFEAIQVLDNTFTNGSNANSSYTAIHLNDCNNASQVIGNRITSTYIKYGIVLDGEGGTLGNEVLVANNFIAMGGAAPFNQAQGIKLAGCSYVNLYFNSVSNYNSYNTGLTGCLYISGTITDETVNIVNNIFSMTGGGSSQVAVYLASTNNRLDIGVSNYNNYYAPSPSSIAYSSGYLDLTAYQSLLLSDANSINIDPEFTSATDLHVSASGLLGAGTAITGITTDIDGDLRATPPTIGADEQSSPITGIVTTDNGFNIYATPNNAIVITSSNTENVKGTVQITDMTGRMVLSNGIVVTSGTGRVQTIGLSPGIYAITFTSFDGNRRISQKVMLKH